MSLLQDFCRVCIKKFEIFIRPSFEQHNNVLDLRVTLVLLLIYPYFNPYFAFLLPSAYEFPPTLCSFGYVKLQLHVFPRPLL